MSSDQTYKDEQTKARAQKRENLNLLLRTAARKKTCIVGILVSGETHTDGRLEAEAKLRAVSGVYSVQVI